MVTRGEIQHPMEGLVREGNVARGKGVHRTVMLRLELSCIETGLGLLKAI